MSENEFKMQNSKCKLEDCSTPNFQLGTSQFTPTPAIETARTETLQPVCLTRKEVAEHLRVSVRTVDRMIASGQLPVRRVLGGVRFLRSDIEDYLSGVRSAECGAGSANEMLKAETRISRTTNRRAGDCTPYQRKTKQVRA